VCRYLSASLLPTVEQLAAWGMRYNSDMQKFLARLNNHQKVRRSVLLSVCWVLRAELETLSALKKERFYDFFLLLRYHILFGMKKIYHHWCPFQICVNSFHKYNKRLPCLILRLSPLFFIVILKTAAFFLPFSWLACKWMHTKHLHAKGFGRGRIFLIITRKSLSRWLCF